MDLSEDFLGPVPGIAKDGSGTLSLPNGQSEVSGFSPAVAEEHKTKTVKMTETG